MNIRVLPACLLLAFSSGIAIGDDSGRFIAEEQVSPQGLSVSAGPEAERTRIVVSGPDGVSEANGRNAFVDATNLRDGSYSYEVTSYQTVPQSAMTRLREADENGRLHVIPEHLQDRARGATSSGTFTVASGEVVSDTVKETDSDNGEK